MEDKNKGMDKDLSYTLKDKILSKTALFKFKQELLDSESDIIYEKSAPYKDGYVGNQFLMIFSLSLLGFLTIGVTLLFLK